MTENQPIIINTKNFTACLDSRWARLAQEAAMLGGVAQAQKFMTSHSEVGEVLKNSYPVTHLHDVHKTTRVIPHFLQILGREAVLFSVMKM
jgi:hypothetical protein